MPGIIAHGLELAARDLELARHDLEPAHDLELAAHVAHDLEPARAQRVPGIVARDLELASRDLELASHDLELAPPRPRPGRTSLTTSSRPPRSTCPPHR
ncbi:hypothetical protein, partial [Microbacterium sp.]|uniref:hypothetical protein n=1 Tax=Microbacterium sp. TaxID=51671 RepID=UPI003735B83D